MVILEQILLHKYKCGFESTLEKGKNTVISHIFSISLKIKESHSDFCLGKTDF